MPCYNCEKYLEEAIESILNQTYADFYLIILDDGSTDHSAQIAQDYTKKDERIKFYQNEENKGIVYTRNRGLSLCDCEFLALMDADDIATKDRLEQEVNFLEQHPDIIAVGGLYQLRDEDGHLLDGKLESVQEDAAIRAHMLFHNPIANGTMMFRKQIIDENGISYRETLHSAEDYRFWSEVLLVGKIYNINRVFQFYRVHADSLENSAKRTDEMNRNGDVYETKKYLLSNLKYRLNEEDTEFFLNFLCAPTFDLSVGDRKRLHRVLNEIEAQEVSNDEIYNREFRKMITRYQVYAQNRIYRRIKRIWSLLK